MAKTRVDETRDGVDLTSLDQPIFKGAGASKRDHIDYLDGVADRIVPVLRDRPLSVIRTSGPSRTAYAFSRRRRPTASRPSAGRWCASGGDDPRGCDPGCR